MISFIVLQRETVSRYSYFKESSRTAVRSGTERFVPTVLKKIPLKEVLHITQLGTLGIAHPAHPAVLAGALQLKSAQIF